MAVDLFEYFDKVRERTMRVVACVPPDRVDWTYREGKFTLGDLMRHLPAAERWMFAENAQRRPSRYPGHGKELADGYDASLRTCAPCTRTRWRSFAASARTTSTPSA